MSPNAWTEGMFPLLGEVEDKYKHKKKRLILKQNQKAIVERKSKNGSLFLLNRRFT